MPYHQHPGQPIFYPVPVLPSSMMLQEYPYHPFPVPVPNHEQHVGKSRFVLVDQVCTNEGNRQMPHPRGDPHSWWPLVGTCGARPHPGPEGHGHFGQTWQNPQAFGTRRKHRFATRCWAESFCQTNGASSWIQWTTISW